MKPEIRTREETSVVYARRIGDYNQSAQEAWGAVCAFAGPKGLIGPQAEFIGCSHDDPSITPAEKLRDASCFEKYLNSPDQVPPEKLLTEIWIPIE